MSIRHLFPLSIRPFEIPVSAAQASEIPGWKHHLPGFPEGPDLHPREAAWSCTGVSDHQQLQTTNNLLALCHQRR